MPQKIRYKALINNKPYRKLLLFGKARESATENLEISRFNIGGGWFLSQNILTKIEYMNQQYKGDAWVGQNARFAGAEFSGINIEAVISF